MRLLQKLLRICSVAFLVLSVLGLVLGLGIYLYLAPGLPTADSLKEVQLQIPLRVYSREGDLLAEYGEKRRIPLTLDNIPKQVQQAFIAAEDDRFFKHPGVDYQGLLRAAVHLLRTGHKTQGGSTITMQLARNIFLTNERTYTRKLREIFLALKMEREFSKQELLELYLNKIYLGNRAYGVGAAAEVYFGKRIDELNLAEIAMIGGLPKAPSAYNPIANIERAKLRRDYVLKRMLALGFIDQRAYQSASKLAVEGKLHRAVVEPQAPYVGEMVRSKMVSQFGDKAYTAGLNVITTISFPLQRAAHHALRSGLAAYDRRHGYRGPLEHLALKDTANEATWDKALGRYPAVGELQTGIVLAVQDKEALVYLYGGSRVTIRWQDLSWARKHLDENHLAPQPLSAKEILSRGDVIRLQRSAQGIWRLAQVPAVSGALVALSPHDGAILALDGGFDFNRSKFNRATQARRQPGSNFKPFIYSAALEHGYTPATIVNDAPVVFKDPALEDTWRPENYSGAFFGPTRLRVALAKSRNLVSIRVLKSIGVSYAINYVTKFGFNRDQLPHDLSLALGSGTVTPLKLAAGYSVFANGGMRITPYFIKSVSTAKDGIVMQANPAVACETPCESDDSNTVNSAGADSAVNAARQTDGLQNESNSTGIGSEQGQAGYPNQNVRLAPRIIPAPNAYQIVSMMQDVIRIGTGRKVKQLGRSDLAGKTGTTNDQRDAWFSGFNQELVTTVWVGFDRLQPLGMRETGAKAALPIWMDFMGVALQGAAEKKLSLPDGMVTVRIDPETGLLASSSNARAIFETFRAGDIPARPEFSKNATQFDRQGDSPGNSFEIPEQLF